MKVTTGVPVLFPDLVVVSGDLTTFGFRQEYLQARAYLIALLLTVFVLALRS
jgi:3',5'-cyclic AMP phosphodiesterase CpdA